MSRARTNWRRLQNIRGHVAKYQTAFHAVQCWDQPPASVAAISCTTLLCFYPHAVLACLLVYLMLHSLFMYRYCPNFCLSPLSKLPYREPESMCTSAFCGLPPWCVVLCAIC